MVESEVHFVDRERLLNVACVNGTVVLIRITIINFETRELGVLNTHIDSYHRQSQDMSFVRFKRT